MCSRRMAISKGAPGDGLFGGWSSRFFSIWPLESAARPVKVSSDGRAEVPVCLSVVLSSFQGDSEQRYPCRF